MLRNLKNAIWLLLSNFFICLTYESIPVIDSHNKMMKTNFQDGPFVTLVRYPEDILDGWDEPYGSILTLDTNELGMKIFTALGASLKHISYNNDSRGIAAAAFISSCVIVTGISLGDVEVGLEDTRHGVTLSSIFRCRLAMLKELEKSNSKECEQKTVLFLVVPKTFCNNDKDILPDVERIFMCVSHEMCESHMKKMEDLYDINIVAKEDTKVPEIALGSAVPSNRSSSLFLAAYKITNSLSGVENRPSIISLLLACDVAFVRHQKTSHAKLAAWKLRTIRGLTIDNFGKVATEHIKRTIDSFDWETFTASGFGDSVAIHRLELRSKLQKSIELSVKELFNEQVKILEKITLKRFHLQLLSIHGCERKVAQELYDKKSSNLETELSLFDRSLDNIQVISLSLTKNRALTEMRAKLNSELVSFPDSPAARQKDMKEIKIAANKKKRPTERSIHFGLDFVVMIRPDGFGKFQGFAGYQLGSNNLIVGIQNDADSPEVISQLGGTRPPFIRIQPKMKLNVEL